MEMSRQRIRASVLESTMKPCPHCGGTGHVRSDSSVALLVVRAIEEFLLKDSRSHIVVKTPASTAMYVLNHKRSTLTEMEARFGVTITIEVDEAVGSQHYAIFRGAIAEKPLTPSGVPAGPTIDPDYDVDPVIEDEEDEQGDETAAPQQAETQPQHQRDGEQRGDRKRRKRRRRRGGRDRENGGHPQGATAESDAIGVQTEGEADESGDETDAVDTAPGEVAISEAGATEEGDRKKRRRGKRGGRRTKADEAADAAGIDGTAETTGASVTVEVAEAPAEPVAEEAVAKTPRKRRSTKAAANEDAPSAAEETPAKTPAKRAPRKKAATAEVEEAQSTAEAVAEVAASTEPVASVPAPPAAETKAELSKPVVTSRTQEPAANEPDRPKKGGWWQRKGFF
jgi:ribonuclease E